MSVSIAPAVGADELSAVRQLFLDYQRALGISLCFQGFERELAQLPGDYSAPGGGLWLALIDGNPVGCVALRAAGERRGEMKRLYVQPGLRGQGIGQRLVDTVLAAATAAGYTHLCLDTLPSMSEAQRMYRRLGFQECAPAGGPALPGTVFMERALTVTSGVL
jgi:ribosomal protein S18 acetylase RimI-like enzyme